MGPPGSESAQQRHVDTLWAALGCHVHSLDNLRCEVEHLQNLADPSTTDPLGSPKFAQ